MVSWRDASVAEYRGYVKCTGDALICFEAALSGSPYIPRISRRWSYPERIACIKSGTILVYNEEESNVKRWTDGRSWTPSRISKNFLMYREKYSDDDVAVMPRVVYPGWLVGSIDNDVVRTDGLVKKSISISVEGVKYSLVSHYLPEDVLSGKLRRPSQFPLLSSTLIRDSILDSVGTRDGVKTFIGSDGIRRPIFELDESEVRSCLEVPMLPEDSQNNDTVKLVSALLTPLPPLAHGQTTPRTESTSELTTTTLLRSPVQLRSHRPQRAVFNPYRRVHDPRSQRQELQLSPHKLSKIDSPLQVVANSPASSGSASDASCRLSPTVSSLSFSPPQLKAELFESRLVNIKEEFDSAQCFNDQIFPTDGRVNQTPDIGRLPRLPLLPSPVVPVFWSEESASEGIATPPVLDTVPSFDYLSHVVGGGGVWLSPSADRVTGYSLGKLDRNDKLLDNSLAPSNAFYIPDPAVVDPRGWLPLGVGYFEHGLPQRYL